MADYPIARATTERDASSTLGSSATAPGADPTAVSPPTLGTAMFARRTELGLTQEELAQRIAAAGDPAFRQSDVSRLEKGRVGLPRRDRLERIARVLGLTAGELLVRSGWIGADTPLVDARPAPPRPTEPAEAPLLAPRWHAPDQPTRPVVLEPRLAVAILRAEETRARSEDLIRRCRERWGTTANG